MKLNTAPCNCHSGVDEMINEGFGGGFIIYEYDRKKLESTQKKYEAKATNPGYAEESDAKWN
ncbi:hypothetical protein J2Z83_002021 [Virgibacillus natechei]|uniref:Uncharacterized protein n=1 Tax=Virgibacillus natechei TaxID=1216297 RepID=A0ABS4IG37_9BACI|nr:hypothetical protein [Virgibacillus natechei]MBP1969913.1 hypothetical protein [Virgibacillus natechei]UZD13422.1 hypothetical protein OLD84_02350 [Virgibacillus natechei]